MNVYNHNQSFYAIFWAWDFLCYFSILQCDNNKTWKYEVRGAFIMHETCFSKQYWVSQSTKQPNTPWNQPVNQLISQSIKSQLVGCASIHLKWHIVYIIDINIYNTIWPYGSAHLLGGPEGVSNRSPTNHAHTRVPIANCQSISILPSCAEWGIKLYLVNNHWTFGIGPVLAYEPNTECSVSWSIHPPISQTMGQSINQPVI